MMDGLVVLLYHHVTLGMALICCIALGASTSLSQRVADTICALLTPGLFLVGCAHFLPSLELGDASRALYWGTGLCQAMLAAGLPPRRTRPAAARLAAGLSFCVWPSTWHLAVDAGVPGALRVLNQLCLVRILLVVSRSPQHGHGLSSWGSAAVALAATGLIAAVPTMGPVEDVVTVVVKAE